MSDFSSILKRGKRIFDMKDKGGEWQRCEECDEMLKCYPYKDEKCEVWMLCEDCSKEFIKDE